MVDIYMTHVIGGELIPPEAYTVGVPVFIHDRNIYLITVILSYCNAVLTLK